jgi:hypothetical protein
MPNKVTLADLPLENLLNTPDDELDPQLRATKRQLELLIRQEDLLPELQACVITDSPVSMVHHPLVVSELFSNACVNDQYRQNFQIAKEARESRDWLKYILIHERPYRLKIFRKIADQLTDAEYWELLGGVYIDSENLRRHGTILHKLLTSNRPHREQMMNGRERAHFRKLSARITIYRGYAHRNAAGWSWTLDKAKAVWFARRTLAGKPQLATGKVKKKDVIAYFSRRKEKEIVVDPKKVKIESREEV